MIYDNNIPHGVIHRFTMKSDRQQDLQRHRARAGRAWCPTNGRWRSTFPHSTCREHRRRSSWCRTGSAPKYHSTVPTVLDKLIAEKQCAGDACGPRASRRRRRPRAASAASNTTPCQPPMRRSSSRKCCRGSRRDYKVTFTNDPDGRRDDGRQFRRCRRVHDGLVSPGALPAGAELLGHVRGAGAHRVRATRRVGYHATFIPSSEKKPIRVWLQVSQNDNGATRDERRRQLGAANSGWRRR